MDLRQRIVASGEPLLDLDQINSLRSRRACAITTESPPGDLFQRITFMPTIIPTTSDDYIVTKDATGYTVTALGAEVATVDQNTGEVCRKRPAISSVTIPRLRLGLLAAILADTLKDCAGRTNSVEAADALLKRATKHIADLEDRADKLAAKSAVAK